MHPGAAARAPALSGHRGHHRISPLPLGSFRRLDRWRAGLDRCPGGYWPPTVTHSEPYKRVVGSRRACAPREGRGEHEGRAADRPAGRGLAARGPGRAAGEAGP